MPRPKLPYVVTQISRHGRRKYYFRIKKGPRTRLPDQYGSVEFLEAYRSALRGVELPKVRTPTSKPETLEWLFESFKLSPAYKATAPATRKQRDNIMKRIIDQAKADKKELLIEHITPQVIRRGMETRADTPAAANNFLKTMRAVFKYAVLKEYAQTNPAEKVEFASKKTDGFPPWSASEVHQFREFYPLGAKPRLAFDLLFYTGLRRSDLVRIGRQHVRNEILEVDTQKTGTTVSIRIAPQLRESIDAAPTGDLIFLITEYGKPFSSDGFGNWFRDKCDAAGISKSAHGLRKNAATRLAEDGATEHELMSVFGWTDSKTAQIYTRKANRRRLGIRASSGLSKEQE